MNLQISNSKYEGFDFKTLTYLVSFKEVSFDARKEVWAEIFHRYFHGNRKFDLYELLKTEKSLTFFAHAMGYELALDNLEIPDSHIETFTQLLLKLVETLDNEAQKEGIEYDFKFDNLQGLERFFAKFSKALPKDSVMVQKLNLFIDRLKQEEVPNALIPVSNTLTDGEFTHSRISATKSTSVKVMLDILKNLNMYYPEDQSRILKASLTHNSDKVRNNVWELYPLRSFVLSERIDDKTLHRLQLVKKQLLDHFERQRIEKQVLDEYLLQQTTGYDWNGFLEYVKCRFKTICNYDEFFWKEWLKQFVSGIDNSMFGELIREDIGALKNAIEQASKDECLLSTFLIAKSEVPRNDFELSFDPKENPPCKFAYFETSEIPWDKSWIYEPRMQTVSRFQYLLEIYQQIKKMPESRFSQAADSFIDTIKWDEQACIILSDIAKTSYLAFSHSKRRSINALNYFTRLKVLEAKNLTPQEIHLLFGTPLGYFVLNHIVFSQGRLIDDLRLVFSRFFGEILKEFDFSDSDQLEHFFSIHQINSELFFSKEEPSYDKKWLKEICNKLERDVPHEYTILKDYFEALPEEPVIKIDSVFLSKEEAIMKGIFDYFKKNRRRDLYATYGYNTHGAIL